MLSWRSAEAGLSTGRPRADLTTNHYLRIVLVTLGATVLFGIAHDQITVRISLEYFTVGHPPLVETDSPTVLALFWGVAATWWAGVPGGFLLAGAARNGRSWPRMASQEVLRRLPWLFGSVAVVALLAGITGALIFDLGRWQLPEHLASRVPLARHHLFFGVWLAHGTSYLAGAAGFLVVIGAILRARFRAGEERTKNRGKEAWNL